MTAALLALAAAVASAEPIIARLGRGTLATEIAQKHGLVVKNITRDGHYARFEVVGSRSPLAVLAAMRADRGLTAVDFDTKIQTKAGDERPTMTKKGSTIPVVGDRASIQAANSDILSAIHWNPALATSPGRRVRIAILDTGLASTAPGLWAKVDASKNFVERGQAAYDNPNGTDSDGDGVADEAAGHGTVVAGIVDAVAPQTRFVIAKVADTDGYASTWNLIEGIQFALLSGAEVVNISLADPKPNMLLTLICLEAEATGITVIASIGNDNKLDAYEPASNLTVITVTAVDLNGVKAPFSNWHSSADVAAPGTSVISRYWTGGGIQWSGTSFSAAFVSGAIADCLRRRARNLPLLVRLSLSQTGGNIDPQNLAIYRGKLGKMLDIEDLNTRLQGLLP